MGIRVTHGKAETIGKMGLEAGKGEQKVRNQADQLERDLTAQNNSARIQAASISANASMQRAVIDAENSKSAMEFQSFMKAEADKRQMAWEVEKIELRQRHDFDLNIQRKDLENGMIMEQKARKDLELNQRKDALLKAKENFEITDEDYKAELLNLELGGRPGAQLRKELSLEGMAQGQSYQAQLAKEKTTAEAAYPENVAMRTAEVVDTIMAEVKDLDPETQAEARKLVQTPNLSETAAKGLLDTIRAKKQIREQMKQATEAAAKFADKKISYRL
jgi:hypothetical protein